MPGWPGNSLSKGPLTLSPSKSTSPPSGWTKPAMIFSRLLLPAPDSPATAIFWNFRCVKETPCRISCCLSCLRILATINRSIVLFAKVQQFVDSHKSISPGSQVPDQLVQAVIEFIQPALVDARMHQDNRAVQPGGRMIVEIFQGLHDPVAAAVIFHPGIGVVRVGADAGCKTKELISRSHAPGCHRIVPPLVRGNEIMPAIDTQRLHGLQVLSQVRCEEFMCDQQAIALVPVIIEEMIIGMRAEIMAVPV